MIIFQLGMKEETRSAQTIPSRTWTPELIKNEFPYFSNKLVAKICERPESERNRIIEALNEIGKIAGNSRATEITGSNVVIDLNIFNIKGDKFTELLVKYPDQLLEIAKISGKDTFSTFVLFKCMAKSFEQYPDKFVEIAKAAGNGTFNAFRLLAIDVVNSAFVKDPEKLTRAFVEIASAVPPGSIANVFAILNLNNAPELFANDPTKFAEIAKANPRRTIDAFVRNITGS
ncbi:MAG: hypothetical protein ABID61_06205 [Candidatus Micrarchaeota archaeon]